MQLHNKAEGRIFKTGKFRKGGAREGRHVGNNVLVEINDVSMYQASENHHGPTVIKRECVR